jgi:hypothetical protein
MLYRELSNEDQTVELLNHDPLPIWILTDPRWYFTEIQFCSALAPKFNALLKNVQ